MAGNLWRSFYGNTTLVEVGLAEFTDTSCLPACLYHEKEFKRFVNHSNSITRTMQCVVG